MKKETENICNIVRECGRMILEASRDGMQIDMKSGRADLVTEYDGKVQQRLRNELHTLIPFAVFVGEEGERETFSESRRNGNGYRRQLYSVCQTVVDSGEEQISGISQE